MYLFQIVSVKKIFLKNIVFYIEYQYQSILENKKGQQSKKTFIRSLSLNTHTIFSISPFFISTMANLKSYMLQKQHGPSLTSIKFFIINLSPSQLRIFFYGYRGKSQLRFESACSSNSKTSFSLLASASLFQVCKKQCFVALQTKNCYHSKVKGISFSSYLWQSFFFNFNDSFMQFQKCLLFAKACFNPFYVSLLLFCNVHVLMCLLIKKINIDR